MRSGESSVEQRTDTRMCVLQRIPGGIKKCEGDGSQMNRETVEKECRTSGVQADMTDIHCLHI